MYGLDLADQISTIKPGGHLCLFYDQDPAEQLPALVPFIRLGLTQDEQCLYIADDQTVGELQTRLEHAGVDVDRECGDGRLKLITRKEWRQNGQLDSVKKAIQVRQFLGQASENGFKGIRF